MTDHRGRSGVSATSVRRRLTSSGPSSPSRVTRIESSFVSALVCTTIDSVLSWVPPPPPDLVAVTWTVYTPGRTSLAWKSTHLDLGSTSSLSNLVSALTSLSVTSTPPGPVTFQWYLQVCGSRRPSAPRRTALSIGTGEPITLIDRLSPFISSSYSS